MIELLAPAGTPEKLRIAILYGADAVYVGGREYGLRARAGNFSLDDISEACVFAGHHRAAVYVTVNIVPHNSNLVRFEEYLAALGAAGVKGVIVTSPHFALTVKKIAPDMELHVSTQCSAVNSEALNFYRDLGFKRAVLGREVSLSQMAAIKSKTAIDLEAFIHGGMCSAYSGRCVLSNYMTGRDANRGGCAHSCRWDYKIIDSDGPDIPVNIASKDLSAVRAVPQLINLGIKSLKIEGRMKSIYYIATTVRAYRMLIDEYASSGCVKDFRYYVEELAKAGGRSVCGGFLYDAPASDRQIYKEQLPAENTFAGVIRDYNSEEKMATLEQRNFFSVGNKLEFFGPQLPNTSLIVTEMFDETGAPLVSARHPRQIIKLSVPFRVGYPDMVRVIK